MEEVAEKKKNAQINRVIGNFILFFGIVILIAIVFTETFIGQMTNLVAGIVLVSIGGGMALVATRALKKLG